MQHLLARVQKKKEQLDTLKPLSNMQVKNLKNVYDVQFTYHSNAIEGSTLTYNEYKDFYEVILKSLNDSLDLYSTILINDIHVI